MKNYKNKIKLLDTTNFENFKKIQYIMQCNDTKQKQNNILIEIIYSHCNYEIIISGLNITPIDNGQLFEFPTSEILKISMLYTTYKYSEKRMTEAKKFLMLNLETLIDAYLISNKNLYI